jgi:hypothetical protein
MNTILHKVFLSAIIICMLAMPAMAEDDVISPVINSVTLDTTEPNTGDDILVTVNATDDVGITVVTANDEPLSNNGVDDTWVGTITAIDGTHTVNISASDAAGNSVYDETTIYTATLSIVEAGGEGVVIDETTEVVEETTEVVDETTEVVEEATEVVDETTEIADETNGLSGEDNMGIPGFGLLTGLSVMLIAIRYLREDK